MKTWARFSEKHSAPIWKSRGCSSCLKTKIAGKRFFGKFWTVISIALFVSIADNRLMSEGKKYLLRD
ncbi:hypothetical protein WA026_005447 [Henosepilachna vigintioctopunctata]|uniref:Uncharacterized protein n=1 Tax=Henosepilachna vigintioctopunctata TaxID=420089 RepID=A0AAW1U0Z5_9CUCU